MVSSRPTALPVRERRADDPRDLAELQTTGGAIVDGGHDGIVEDVRVEVDEEPGEIVTRHSHQRRLEGVGQAVTPDVVEVVDQDRRVAHVRAEVPVRAVRDDPVAEQRDVVVAHERPATLDIGHDPRAAAGGQRQVHRGSLAVRILARVGEVGVAVEEQQAVASAPAKRKKRPQKDAAVTAEHDGEGTPGQHGAYRIAERTSVVGERRRIPEATPGVDLAGIGRWRDKRPASGCQPLGKSGIEQDPGELLHALGKQAEDAGRLKDLIAGHVALPGGRRRQRGAALVGG